MPITWSYDHVATLLTLRLTGDWIGTATTRTALHEMVAAGYWNDEVRVLVDLREVTVQSIPPFPDLWLLAHSIDGVHLPGRMAFLVRPGVLFGLARTLERLANGSPDRVASFTSDIECVAWLLAGSSHPPLGPN